MNTCSDFIQKFEKRQRKKELKKRFLIVFLCLFFVFIVCFLYYFLVIKEVVINFTKSSIDRMLTDSVNNSINDIINNKIFNFDAIISIEKDKNNKINSLSINSSLANTISNDLALKTQNYLNKQTKFGVEIPIVTLSGIFFLNGKGNCLNFSCTPIGEVKCAFNSEFNVAGINQTIHRLFVEIKSKVCVNLPIKNYIYETVNTFLLNETIIVGDVPTVYIK